MSVTYLTYLIGGVVLLVILAAAFFASRLRIAPPDKVIIVSGSSGRNGERKVVMPGGRTFVLPLLQSSTMISLQTLPIRLVVENAVDQNAIPVDVEAVAMVKVGSEPRMILAAAERFADQQNTIGSSVTDVLSGSLRSIIGTMETSALLSDREELATKVASAAQSDLGSMGLTLDTLQIKEITDKNRYIENLGVAQSSEIEKQARISMANAKQEAAAAEVEADKKIAEKNKELAIYQAQIKQETDTQQAQADAAGPLAQAAQAALIAQKQQEAAEEKAKLREKELDTEVRKPADAENYRAKQEADAQKYTQIAQAQAQAEARREQGNADAEMTERAGKAKAESARMTGLADAEIAEKTGLANAAAAKAVGLAEAEIAAKKGEAEAQAKQAIGLAEAEALNKRADALKKYGNAAIAQSIVEKLPELASAIAGAYGNVDNITLISNDGTANGMASSVTKNATEISGIVKALTGVDLGDVVGGLAGKQDSAADDSTTSGDAASPAK